MKNTIKLVLSAAVLIFIAACISQLLGLPDWFGALLSHLDGGYTVALIGVLFILAIYLSNDDHHDLA